MLKDFIAGLNIIFDIEPSASFSAEHDVIYIADLDHYDENDIRKLENLGFNIEEELNCFYYFT